MLPVEPAEPGRGSPLHREPVQGAESCGSMPKPATPFKPGVHYWVGGNTKVFGAAFPRLRPQDFDDLEHEGGTSPAWPISYDDLEPYYGIVERWYRVHGEAGVDPTEGWRSTPYPHPARTGRSLHGWTWPTACVRTGCIRSPCRSGSISRPAGSASAAEPAMPSRACLTRRAMPISAASDPRLPATSSCRPAPTSAACSPTSAARRSPGSRRPRWRLRNDRGRRLSWSPAARSIPPRSCSGPPTIAHPRGLANSLGSGRPQLHGPQQRGPDRDRPAPAQPDNLPEDAWRSTTSISPAPISRSRSAICSRSARSKRPMLKSNVPRVPDFVLGPIAGHSTDWWVMSEDLPDPDNRVTLGTDGSIRVNWTRTTRSRTANSSSLAGRVPRGRLQGDDRPRDGDRDELPPGRHASLRHRSGQLRSSIRFARRTTSTTSTWWMPRSSRRRRRSIQP